MEKDLQSHPHEVMLQHLEWLERNLHGQCRKGKSMGLEPKLQFNVILVQTCTQLQGQQGEKGRERENKKGPARGCLLHCFFTI